MRRGPRLLSGPEVKNWRRHPNTFPTFRIVRLCETGVEYLLHKIVSAYLLRGSYHTYDTFPKFRADLSSFKSVILDGLSGSNVAIDSYSPFAARSRAFESMHGIYERCE
jgi:hypothetical protein